MKSNSQLTRGAYALVAALILIVVAVSSSASPRAQVIKVAVTNPSDSVRLAQNIVLQISTLKSIAPDFDASSAVVTASNASSLREDARSRSTIELPSQADDMDGDQKLDELVFQIDLQPKQTRIVAITFGGSTAKPRTVYPPRTHAKFTTRFEGIGWESDVTAWRLYFDKRNAIDLFGKRSRGLYLELFGKPDYNYHEESPYGRDIYKIGNALGIGAIGAFVDGKVIKVAGVTDRSWKIISTGPVRAIAELNYKGWQVGGRLVDLTSRFTVWAGERGFDHQITAKNAEGLTLITGLPKKPGVSEITSTEIGLPMRLVADWGHQVLMTGATATESLPDQNLGLGIILSSGSSSPNVSLGADADNLLAVVPLVQGSAHWYVFAAWDQEKDSITTRDQFVSYAKNVASRFDAPATVTILSKQSAH